MPPVRINKTAAVVTRIMTILAALAIMVLVSFAGAWLPLPIGSIGCLVGRRRDGS